ncbi:MAG TPA: VWA domain-containing protein [Acidobacteriaceae bacterium]|nr:VWA domain-containing protein [Acidobacteriaceae bacterium]
MRLSHLGSLLAALCLSPLATSTAQAPARPEPESMTINVTVSTHNGEPVADLTRDDFTLTDNKHPQSITGFRALTGTVTGVVIVLDAVNLPYSQVSFARQQLGQFFSANAHLPQPVALGVLENSGLKMQPEFTADGNALRSELDRYSIGLRELPRSTGIYGAEERLQLSLSMFKGLVAQLPREGLKRIIWISPGWPLLGGPGIQLNNSQRDPLFASIVAFATELRRSQIVVDAVNPVGSSEDVGQANFYETFLHAPRSPHDVELGQLGVQVLAQQSGGLVLNGSNDIAGLIQRAIAQTESVYQLTFAPAPGEHENEYHELQVKVRRPGVIVHTSAGYYAKPVYPEFPRPAISPDAN